MKKRYFIWTYDRELDLSDHIKNMQLENFVIERTKVVNGIIIETESDNVDFISRVREYCKQHGLMALHDRDQYLQQDESI